jgi:hypothetical protein
MQEVFFTSCGPQRWPSWGYGLLVDQRPVCCPNPNPKSQVQTSKDTSLLIRKKVARVPRIYSSSRSAHLLTCSVGAEKFLLVLKGLLGHRPNSCITWYSTCIFHDRLSLIAWLGSSRAHRGNKILARKIDLSYLFWQLVPRSSFHNPSHL